MSTTSLELAAGQIVSHAEMGVGVVATIEPGGFARVFFRAHGERQVSVASLSLERSWEEQVVSEVRPAMENDVKKLWLALEAEQLPLMESAATLTAAKVDLLPHQIVLTYRVANAMPRRFLVADSVGLGKTIETALILRELASRGELTRALMVVPAGLVENWRRELNETFNLDFEVFGAEGDVTDRRSNAFAKHDRLIASIDTLKRPARVRRLLEAPPWDLIVFDEAHHLTAYKFGSRVKKTQNFKLGEALRDHSRDLMLLSATPHQGDHFRFWMLVRLLDPRLFQNPDDMIENRHRLNAVVFRRTQADACDAHGEPLFCRRQVHTQGFHLSENEQRFYDALTEYLSDGYNLAAQAGKEGRALGFVMTIFQKIAASSFAAVGATLRRRLLMLTIHEAIVCDENLNTDGRDRAMADARDLIQQMHGLPNDAMGRAEADRLLADAKIRLLRKLGEKVAEVSDGTELAAASDEDSAATLVSVALPAERGRIKELLEKLPLGHETKTTELLRGLADLWAAHPDEKIVIFTTYLGSVDTLRSSIGQRFPDAGVEILKGGDHGAKVAAERRFKRSDGPRVLVCTAAGREGINLQFARVLFNHDLPWNPMDVEQRIGRIHRYGQKHTAQVYNLVSTDTIEGQIFLLLEEKLLAIAEALGKVDEFGQVAEDLRSQVLGQLSERVSYDKLYQDAINDPTLRQTRQELEVAVDNARTARDVVFELFQELESFRLDDYKQFDDSGAGMERLLQYVQDGVGEIGGKVASKGETLYEVSLNGEITSQVTTSRERAKETEELTLLGLEHPLVLRLMAGHTDVGASSRALAGRFPDTEDCRGCLTIWRIEVHGAKGQFQRSVMPIGLDESGERSRRLEQLGSRLRELRPIRTALFDRDRRTSLVRNDLPEMIRRALTHAGSLPEGASFSARLLAWVEIS
ncbi:MAG: DEAD/DEAH box helicase family protein [Phycisphaerales bacterium]|jgi:SNF2 family DNA or RNA helicase|nr:DEAD/DEAH box helicase family protein [Phycisphaerales bacterium]